MFHLSLQDECFTCRNLETLQWDKDALQKFGLDLSCLPEILSNVDDFGEVDC